MGADLSIRSIYHYDAEKHTFVGNEEEGYFRDSYNSTSLLWAIGVSWWNDVSEHLDDAGDLQSEGIVWLQSILNESKAKSLPSREELEERHAHVEDTGEQSLEGWHNYFRGKRERLLAFLNRALERNEPIHCSI